MKRHFRTYLAVGLTTVALSASTLTPGLIDQASAQNYPRSAYGANPNAGKNANGQNGWGPYQWGSSAGCPTASMLGVAVSKSGDRSQVRKELVPLVTELLNRTEAMGYNITSSGAFNCRRIAGTNKPSNHSRGRAIDINPAANPQSSTFKSDLPPRVVAMWEAHGFYWGGRYNPPTKYDAMHFEYYDTPASVAVNYRKLTNGGAVDNCKDSTATVKKGSRGEAVRDAQCLLQRKGFNPGTIDGIFGDGTHRATVAFQKSRGLKQDGIVGANTWAALKA